MRVWSPRTKARRQSRTVIVHFPVERGAVETSALEVARGCSYDDPASGALVVTALGGAVAVAEGACAWGSARSVIIVASAATLVAACSRVVGNPGERCRDNRCRDIRFWGVRKVTRGRRNELGKEFTSRVVLSQSGSTAVPQSPPTRRETEKSPVGFCLTHGGPDSLPPVDVARVTAVRRGLKRTPRSRPAQANQQKVKPRYRVGPAGRRSTRSASARSRPACPVSTIVSGRPSRCAAS